MSISEPKRGLYSRLQNVANERTSTAKTLRILNHVTFRVPLVSRYYSMVLISFFFERTQLHNCSAAAPAARARAQSPKESALWTSRKRDTGERRAWCGGIPS